MQELATQLQLQEVKYEGIVDGLKAQVNDTRKTLEGKIDVLAKEVGSDLWPISCDYRKHRTRTDQAQRREHQGTQGVERESRATKRECRRMRVWDDWNIMCQLVHISGHVAQSPSCERS